MFPSHSHQNGGKKYFMYGLWQCNEMNRKIILLKAKNCYSYSKAAPLYGGACPWHSSTKTDFMYEKSNVKTNIIRYYFVAIHPVHKATSLRQGHRWMCPQSTICIHTCVMGPCRKKHLLASLSYQHFSHSQSRVTRDSACHNSDLSDIRVYTNNFLAASWAES